MTAEEPRSMLVAGVMSGTSADGVDVALVRIAPGMEVPAIHVLGHRGFAYPDDLRQAVLRAMDARQTSVAELARLNWRLGAMYADCVEAACSSLGVGVGPGAGGSAGQGAPGPHALHGLELVGMHGQTIYHQAAASDYMGAAVRATWQIGEAAVVRERLGIPVVSDFRAADLAAGGQGAPLVPMLDYTLFRSATVERVLLNLGGIANVTVLPAGCGFADVIAFDTGPANMVMDALMLRGFGKPYDEDGAQAAKGKPRMDVVERLLQDEFFRASAPKSCGREQFGEGFVAQLAAMCDGACAEDLLATAAELTVRSVAEAIEWHGRGATEVIAAGGGIRNTYLMRRLADALPGGALRTAEKFGIAAQAKEAVAFALLAWLSWFGQHGNVASATGARGGRVLGKICW